MEFKTSAMSEENAAKFADWIKNRGGIAIWKIQLIGGGPNNTKSYSTPANKLDGSPMDKPHWSVGNKPDEIVTDPAEVSVVIPKEVKRFHIALRMGSQGLVVKCTDASSRRIRAAVEKAGKGAWYEFDYSSQEAVIYQVEKEIPLKEWMESQVNVSGA